MCELPSPFSRLARIVRPLMAPFCGSGANSKGAWQDGSMATIARFKIGAAFPADDPMARFVTVLAMVSNDRVRAVKELETTVGETVEAQARRTRLFRWLTASQFEAIDFISNTHRLYWAEVDRLLRAPDAGEALAEVLAAKDPRSEKYLGDWPKKHRNITFHYAKVHPDAAANGREEIQQALRDAADLDGEIVNGDVLTQNLFPFADEVVVQWMPADPEVVLERLATASVDLVMFTQIAVREYLKTLPKGVMTVERR